MARTGEPLVRTGEPLVRAGMYLALERRRALRAWLPWGHVRGVPVLRGSWDRRHALFQVVALGLFKLVRDADDAAVGEDGADLREKEIDEQGEGGHVIC